MHPLVVPPVPLQPEPIETLPEAPAAVHGDDRHQGSDHCRVGTRARPRRPVVRRPRQPHHATGAADGELMLLHQHLEHLSLRRRRYSFRPRTSLIAAFSSARSAYIRLSFAFSASSSRRRFTSLTVAPAYLLRHLKNVALLIA